MAENKTKATAVDVTAYINALENAEQRQDSHTLVEMMARLSGQPPKMWGPTMIGFGQYHYAYESGREGDMFRIGFAPRKGQIVLYLAGGTSALEAITGKLGKFKTGKSCIYIKNLSTIDKTVFEELCAASIAYMEEKYPA